MEVTAGLSKVVHQPLETLEIEARAMEEGVTFAWDVGIMNVIFEGDSKIVFDALIWLYKISQLAQGFRSVKVSHVKWQSNRSAHILASYAKEVLNRDNYVTWIEENTTLIKSALTQDVLNLSSSY